MLVSKNAKIYVSPNAKTKICVEYSGIQWNIGCVGSPTQNFRIGKVHLFLMLISFAFGSQLKPSFQWNMGYNVVIFLNILFFAGVVCHPSLTIQNSNVSNSHGAYGAVIQVRCMQGYTLTTEEKLFSVLCQEDGEWNTTVNRCDRKHRRVS